MKKIILVFFALLTIGINAQTIAGGNHSLFVCANGSARATGPNASGQHGNGTNISTLNPFPVNSISNVIAVASGDEHSLFLKSDGTVFSSGLNSSGQLGDNTTTNRNIPVQVLGLTGIIKIVAGAVYSLFLKNDGTVWACGSNNYGQLGIGDLNLVTTPVQVVGVTNVTAIAAGEEHSMFLKNDGTVRVCGRNINGSDIVNYSFALNIRLPVIVPIADVVAIAGGETHSIFVKQDGTVWTSGNNFNGQTGQFATNRSLPQQADNLTGIVGVAAGSAHSLFLKNDGTVWAVGRGSQGQRGDGFLTNRFTAAQVPTLANVTEIAAQFNRSFFKKNDGTIFACGRNAGGFGNGITPDSSVPVLVSVGCATLSNLDFTKNQFSVYPNPSTGIFTILTENAISNAVITVADLNGRVVHQSKTENLVNNTLDLNVLQSGIYILNVSNAYVNYSQKLVKQ